MCGIVGFFNPTKGSNWNADRILPELMFASQLRGRDSVGLIAKQTHHRDEDFVDHLKMIGPTDAFLNWKDPHDRVIKKAEHMSFVVAHNRSSTIGSKDDIECAHPLITENILLVHNGTLRDYPDKKKYKSDSAAIAGALEQNGDFREVDNEIFGPYVFVWYDKRNKSLNFVRNAGRPLSFVQAIDGVFWFASEPKMLEWVLERNNKRIEKTIELKERTWIKWTVDGKIKEIDVPFVRGKHTKRNNLKDTTAGGEIELTPEEFAALPETKRAFETIIGGSSAVKSFADCDVDMAEVPKEVTRPTIVPSHPFVHHGSVSSLRSTVRQEKPEVKSMVRVEEWSGLKVGDKAYFYPLHFNGAGKDFQKVAMDGPMLVFVDAGGVQALDGVEVRGRLAIDLDNETNIGDKVLALASKKVGYESTITAFSYDTVRRKMILWVKEASPEDWFNVDEFGLPEEEIEAAYKKNFDVASAPEVAALEKKFREVAAITC